MIRCYQICDGKPAMTGTDLALPCEGGMVWCHVNGREPVALAKLMAMEDVPHAARIALSAIETRPRSDRIGDGELINLRGPGETPEDDPDELVSVRLWVTQGRAISLGYNAPAAVQAVTDRFMAGEIHDPGDLATAFAKAVTFPLDDRVAKLGDELDEIELQVDKVQARATRRRVHGIRAQSIRLRRFVVPQRDALERLSEARHAWLEEDDRLGLREAADRFARMGEELESIRERASIVHDELTDMRAEVIETRALLLSIVALIFLPLTFITGLLGMNVKGIPYADESWAFWGVVGFCVIVGLMVLAWFIAAHWIKRDGEE